MLPMVKSNYRLFHMKIISYNYFFLAHGLVPWVTDADDTGSDSLYSGQLAG